MINKIKLYDILKLIYDILNDFKIEIENIEHDHNIENYIEYINIRIKILDPNASLTIREYWKGNVLVAYGYYIRVGGYEEWWDNRPHHPEIRTYPHHRHVGGKVLPLDNPGIESFLLRVRTLLLNTSRGVSEND